MTDSSKLVWRWWCAIQNSARPGSIMWNSNWMSVIVKTYFLLETSSIESGFPVAGYSGLLPLSTLLCCRPLRSFAVANTIEPPAHTGVPGPLPGKNLAKVLIGGDTPAKCGRRLLETVKLA